MGCRVCERFNFHKKNSVVLAGSHQTENAHLVTYAINQSLGVLELVLIMFRPNLHQITRLKIFLRMKSPALSKRLW